MSDETDSPLQKVPSYIQRSRRPPAGAVATAVATAVKTMTALPAREPSPAAWSAES